MKKLFSILVLFFIINLLQAQNSRIWTAQKANDWYKQQHWSVGCNFIPSTAINELEMWQPETFDTATINRELSWAHNIGMNAARVFLIIFPGKVIQKVLK